MFRWLAGTLLALSVLSAPAARAAVSPFEPVPANHWAYSAVRRLEGEGYFTGAPQGTFNGKRSLTRYEFAVALARIYQNLQPRVLTATGSRSLARDVEQIRELLTEFSSDVQSLGSDVSEIRRELDAMSQRLESVSAARGEVELSLQPRRALGLRHALEKPLMEHALGLNLNRPATAAEIRPTETRLVTNLQPGAAGNIGSAQVSVAVAPASPLYAERPRFETAGLRQDYRAKLSVPFSTPVGRYLVSAFYDHNSGQDETVGLGNPYFHLGPSEGLGGALSTDLGSFNLQVKLAQLRLVDDDTARALIFKGDLKYGIGAYNLGVGFERTWLDTPGTGYDFSTLTAGVGRQLGKNARLDILYRYYTPGRGIGDASGHVGGDSSAITQFSVRF